MRARPAVCITTGRHLGATADGEVSLTLSGPAGCRGTVTLKSERRIPSRWLERGRPRVVTLARRAFELPAEGRAEVVLRLPPEQEALLHRMGSIHAVARVATPEARAGKAVTIHARRIARPRSRPKPRSGATPDVLPRGARDTRTRKEMPWPPRRSSTSTPPSSATEPRSRRSSQHGWPPTGSPSASTTSAT